MNVPLKAAAFDSMNYGELEVFESIVGIMPTTEDELATISRAKLMIALGFIAAKREDPSVTVEDVKALPLGSIVLNEDEESEGKD